MHITYLAHLASFYAESAGFDLGQHGTCKKYKPKACKNNITESWKYRSETLTTPPCLACVKLWCSSSALGEKEKRKSYFLLRELTTKLLMIAQQRSFGFLLYHRAREKNPVSSKEGHVVIDGELICQCFSLIDKSKQAFPGLKSVIYHLLTFWHICTTCFAKCSTFFFRQHSFAYLKRK